MSFLGSQPGKPYLFFERTRHLLDVVSHEWPASVRNTIAELDLTYYFPCTVRGRTIAYLGVSRTDKGDFLSSDDVELLVTLAGYVSIAVENARLYRSLQRKVEEYERLKEFSENIVESINVGILAADLGRPRGKLEHADRAAHRHRARGRGGAASGRIVPAGFVRKVRTDTRRNQRSQYLQICAAQACPMDMGQISGSTIR